MKSSNSFLVKFPEIAKQWHPKKNKNIELKDATSGMDRVVWWKCPVAEDHEWQSRISLRAGGKSNCPYCVNQRVSITNSLCNNFLDIAKEWHPTKNNNLKPNQIIGTTEKKVWWKCDKGNDHEWQQGVKQRTIFKSKCPYCSNRKVSKTNNLKSLNPLLAKEWHPTKNKNLMPNDVVAKSTKKVWWQCKLDPSHEWQTSVSLRYIKKTKCPFCVNKKVSKTNNLEFRFPEIAKQWHPKKNGDKKPNQYTYGSGTKVWWRCNINPEHEWKTRIGKRTREGTNCPYCTNSTSDPEIRIMSEFIGIFGRKNVLWRHKVGISEIDIYLKKFNIGIEYDGYYWHKEKHEQDLKKNIRLSEKGIDLIRTRAYPLKKISKNDILVKKNKLTKEDLNNLIRQVILLLKNESYRFRNCLLAYTTSPG